MSNAELRLKKEEVGKLVSSVNMHPSLASCLSDLESRYVLIIFLMSKAELRLKKEEMGEMYHVPSTKYKVEIRSTV